MSTTTERAIPTRNDGKRYHSVRKHLLDGDFLLFSGRGVWSNLIRLWTRQEFSHCGMIAWWGNRCCVLEAKDGWGVRLVPTSELVTHYSGRIVWYSVVDPQFNRFKSVDYGASRLGSHYSWLQNAALALGIDADACDQRFNCSEFLGSCLRAGGLELLSKGRKILTPGDFASVKNVTCFGTIG